MVKNSITYECHQFRPLHGALMLCYGAQKIQLWINLMQKDTWSTEWLCFVDNAFGLPPAGNLRIIQFCRTAQKCILNPVLWNRKKIRFIVAKDHTKSIEKSRENR